MAFTGAAGRPDRPTNRGRRYRGADTPDLPRCRLERHGSGDEVAHAMDDSAVLGGGGGVLDDEVGGIAYGIDRT